MDKIPVYDDNGGVVGIVNKNTKLDFWDGHNNTCGSTGRHLGYTKLRKSGKYVLIFSTQWQGERDSAEITTPRELIANAARAGCLDQLYSDYPELRDLAELDSD